jgi:hypothetical protein
VTPRALAPARRRLLVLATALAVALAGSLTLAAPASAAPRTLEGVVRLLADAPREAGAQGHGAEQLFLLVGDEAYRVTGRKLTPNTRVRVSGQVTGDTVDVDSARTLADLGPVASLPTTGVTETLVMLVTWPGLSPDHVTPAGAAQQLFDDTDGWYREVSYGALGLSGEVTPWMTIAGPAGGKCYADHWTIMSQAKAQATAGGYDIDSYDNWIVYFPWAGDLPGADCSGSAGWAYIGSTDVWLNGYMDRRVTTHELGHNYGLWHGDSHLCPGGGVGAVDCVDTEYGDYYDAMGSSYPAHFSSPQKDDLGWLGGGRTVDLTEGGSTTLVPMTQQSTAPHAARMQATADRTYWVEYRQETGYDDVLTCCGTDGVLVHVEDWAIGQIGPDLLDVSPGDGVNEWTATLKPGTSWTSPEGYRIAAGTMSASGAAVTVTAPGGDRTAPGVTGRTPASAGTGAAPTTNVTATFDEPVLGVSAMTFELYSAASGRVPAAVTYDSATRTATLNPNTDLTADTRYTAYLTGGASLIRDTAGNPLAAESWTFTTGPAPRLTARSPATNATAVATTANATLTFSEPVVGVSGATFILTTPSGKVVPATVSYNATTRVATLNPTANLPPDIRFTASMAGGTTAVRDRAGNPLPSTTWSFTTGPAPTVSSRYPASGQTGISRTANVAAVFSEAVQGVSTTTATLRTSAGTAVSAVVSYDATTRRLTLNPNSTLAARTVYTATLTGGTTGIRDLAGNPLTTTRWSFTTGS